MNRKEKSSLEHSISLQLDANRSKNLLFDDAEKIMDIDPGFLAALEKLLDSNAQAGAAGASQEMVAFAAQAFLKKVYSVNRYLRVSDLKVQELQDIYLQTWRIMLETRDIQAALRGYHYPELSRWLAELYPREIQDGLRHAPRVGHVVYEQYSAELQMELLGIDPGQLKQPVIDVGCGSQANLVQYLRAQGLEAYGFDHQLEAREAYLEQMDWFVYPFEPGRWGTIISNMAFSNHLNYVYLHDTYNLEQYLLKMKQMLESLAAGGCFFYAPSLPFIEDRLAPEHYRVERRRGPGEFFVSVVERLGSSE